MEALPQLTKREELIDFLNFKRYNLSTITIKDIIEEFRATKQISIPTSTAYRIVKKWNEEQLAIREQSLNRCISDKLLKVFDS